MSNNGNTRILLVDDEYDITLAFKIVLEESGFAVDSFNDSLLALTSFKSKYLRPVITRYQNAKDGWF
jgi:DNA-binding response OmpR family regulator